MDYIEKFQNLKFNKASLTARNLFNELSYQNEKLISKLDTLFLTDNFFEAQKFLAAC